jgi:hypothetical protein
LAIEIAQRVGAEYLGQARLYRSAVLATDRGVDLALVAIANPLKVRLRTKTALRPEQVIETERAWRKWMPSAFRLGDVRVMKAKTELAIAEDRSRSAG